MTPQGNESHELGSEGPIWPYLYVGVVVVICVGTVYAIILVGTVGVGDDGARFGDSFGALTSLFTGLGLAGVLIGLLYQAQQQKLQARQMFLQIRASHDSATVSLVLQHYRTYSAPEMLRSVHSLWEWHSETKSSLGISNRVENLTRQEEQRIAKELQFAYEEVHNSYGKSDEIEPKGLARIHVHRRNVAKFYVALAALYAEGLVPKGMLYNLWSREDLEVIRNIILPVHYYLAGVVASRAMGGFFPMEVLVKLYNDAPSPKGKPARQIDSELLQALASVAITSSKPTAGDA